MAVLNVKHGWNPYLAIAAGVLAGHGDRRGSRDRFPPGFGVPSFVVTLAGLLAWQGALLYVLGDTGTVNITDGKITGLANTFYSDTVGWIIALVAIGAYAAATLWAWRQRVAAGLADSADGPLIIRIAVVAAAVIAAVAILNSDRGVPLAVLILVGFVAGMQYVAARTRFGRHVFAVGGNAEAARRAGINVTRSASSCSRSAARWRRSGESCGLAAAGGEPGLRRQRPLLLAIAGPVIAGTSLFGGRGSVWSALLGALVIGSISNGMDLLALESSVKFMVTGGVLLAAVIVDAIARRQRQAAGRL